MKYLILILAFTAILLALAVSLKKSVDLVELRQIRLEAAIKDIQGP